MSSVSLLALHRGFLEVQELRSADPTPVGEAPSNPEISRAVGRASVVLLSSHFERYVYAINEEATELLNANPVRGDQLPMMLRLLHSQQAVDELSAIQWDNREERLASFVEEEAWLWGLQSVGALAHKRLLSWMKAPTPAALLRYYRCWGVKDVFSAITRAPHTRTDLWLRIEELVGKRNNIAHGDLSTEATSLDLDEYHRAARTFCDRTDRLLGGVVGSFVGHRPAW